MNLLVGTVLQGGKYVVRQVLAQSSHSLTLQATNARSQRVILQTISPELQHQSQFPSVKHQFIEHVRQLSHCQHPALVRLIDSFEEQNLPFAVMDDTPGQTLVDVVHTQGALPVSVALRYIQQVGAALSVLHQRELIHQGVSPGNLVHPPNSEIVVLVNVKLMPAVVAGGAERSLRPATPEYAAIEQYQPQMATTPLTDLYGLAGTLYFLVTGHAPIAAPLRHQTAIVAPRQFNPQISSALEAAILQGLAMNPKARPALAAWLSRLTEATAHCVVTHAVNPAVSPTASQSAQPLSRSTVPTHPAKISNPLSRTPSPPMLTVPSKRFSGAIVTTMAIAAAIGIGTGLVLRLAATTTGSGTTFLHSTQSFPTLENWPGESLPIQTPEVVPDPLPPVPAPVQERLPVESPSLPPAVPTPAPEAIAPLPEEAPAEPPALPSTVAEPVAPPAAAPPSNAIAPEPAPVAPPAISEPAPPPPTSSQPAPPATLPN